jgi:protein TonB
MSDSTLGFHSPLTPQTPFLQRLRENLQSLCGMARVRVGSPLAAASAPIHLLDERREQPFSAHAGSTALHLLGSAVVLALLAHPAVKKIADKLPVPRLLPTLHYTPAATPGLDQDHLGIRGSSGDHNPLPATKGELPPYSRIVIAAPRPNDDQLHKLAVKTSVFAADAPEFAPPVSNIGLPWAPQKNDSGGPGSHGLGNGEQGGVGDNPIGDGIGRSKDAGPYGIAASLVACKYCPDPVYSDEARKVKLQGHVTLRVLVGSDGRAHEVQLMHGLGMGLDESAVDAVRTWQFIPARDAAHRNIASWITIETMFRLF